MTCMCCVWHERCCVCVCACVYDCEFCSKMSQYTTTHHTTPHHTTSYAWCKCYSHLLKTCKRQLCFKWVVRVSNKPCHIPIFPLRGDIITHINGKRALMVADVLSEIGYDLNTFELRILRQSGEETTARITSVYHHKSAPNRGSWRRGCSNVGNIEDNQPCPPSPPPPLPVPSPFPYFWPFIICSVN